jgi:hypothetical protein
MARTASPGMLLKERVHQLLIAKLEGKIENRKAYLAASGAFRLAEIKQRCQLKADPSEEFVEMEIKKAGWQKAYNQQLLDQLLAVNPRQRCKTVEFGSLVIIPYGLYFLGIPAGPVEIDDLEVNAVDVGSPMGKIILGHRVGTTLQWDGIDFRILEIF